MTITRPTPAPAVLPQPLNTLRRWATTLATTTPRTKRARPRSTLAHPPAPTPSIWELDRAELTSALEHGRW